MNSPNRLPKIKAVAALAVAVVSGYLLATYIPLAGRSHDEMNREAALSHDHEGAQQLWTCGMHPDVILDEPGTCPICSMNLVPIDAGNPSPRFSTRGDRELLFYRNPMDPSITSPVPMKDSMGMDYVAVYSTDAEEMVGEGTAIRIDPAVVQNMNVRTARVERRDLVHPIRTVGYLDYDQERMVSVTTKYSGWVEKVHVNYVGEKVTKGSPLFEIYSPELVQTEEELLSALRFSRDLANAPKDALLRAEALVEAARTRLRYWDISDLQIDRLEATGEVFRTLTVVAPASGLVMKKMTGLEGMAVMPGMQLYHVANLKSLWLSVEVFENQIQWVEEGTSAEISLSYFPGETFHGTVRYLEPELSEQTRTLSVRIEVSNPDQRLRKGMFATVSFTPTAVEDGIVVPSAAVLRTGRRSVIIVAQGEGRFVPRDVTIGHTVEGFTEVLEGVSEDEEVVVSAQFLLDSESKLREAIQKMVAAASSDSAGTARSVR